MLTNVIRDRALDSVKEGVTLANHNRELIYANAAYLRMTGFSHEELQGQSIGRMLRGPDTDPATIEQIRSTLMAEQPFHGEILNYRKDGTSFWNELSIAPIFDEEGVVVEYLGVQRDITAQKNTELSLRKSEEQLKLVLKSTNDGLWDWDISRKTIDRSPSWYEMLGYEVNCFPMETASWADLLHPDDVDRCQGELKTHLASIQDRFSMELRLKHKSGHYLTVLFRAYIQRDSSGRPMRVCGTCTNLTEQKEKEINLNLAAKVFRQCREGIAVTDTQHNVVMINSAFTKITGYTEEEMRGKSLRMLSSGRHDPDFFRLLWNEVDANDLWSGEIWDKRKDGTDFPAWLTISALRDGQGNITNYLGSFVDLSDAKAAESKIQRLSHFDTLTGLPNLALLRDRTAHSISVSQRASEPMTLMLLGIDNFKSVNDTLGHHIGDALLVEIAKRLSGSVREQDTVARLGGKEFVLVLPETHSEGAAHLASELLWKLSAPCRLADQDLAITVSIGVATYPENGNSFDDLFKAVEIAMHRAQAEGRNTFRFYSDDMYRQVLAHDTMTKALRFAAEYDQLQLFYQPLVDLETGKVSGMEALLRWNHPTMGAVSPCQFIPIAEESGLIKSIGEWALRRACRDIRIWLNKGIEVPHVAVNVSSLQFGDAELISQVRNSLKDFEIEPSRICLEVTESALMGDARKSEAILTELKKLGIKLSLDDFGTGYSSLSYLKRFPFDKVKIDQSFVRDIAINQSDAVIVKVIVSMAHGLGLKVIAEGVETETQCEIMRAHVCDEIQGYLFSRPISASAIEELFKEGKQLPSHLLRFRKPKRTLLLVDDEPNVLASLKRLFRRDGHNILTANSGSEGLDVLARNKVDVIISDQRMPGMTGVEFLRTAKLHFPETIRIVLSGYTELQSVTEAINEGAIYRFLTKPWEDEQLREHIHKAFEYKELLEENQQLDIKIRTTNQELVTANRQLGEILQKTRTQIERDETTLAIVQEALQHMPLPVIALDDEGVIAFVNSAAESLLSSHRQLLGEELVYALPTIYAVVSETEEGISKSILIGEMVYSVKWNAMGRTSLSRGKTITLSPSSPSI